jgi:hypothetical protein
LAVARKMVCYVLAVERRQQDFVPAEEAVWCGDESFQVSGESL